MHHMSDTGIWTRRGFGLAGRSVAAAGMWAAAGLAGAAYAGPTIVQVSGDAETQAAVDDFRALLGGPNNGDAPGSQGTGRREINWDGAGAAGPPLNIARDAFALRGVVFTGPTGGQQISGGNGDPSSVDPAVEEFGNFNPDYPGLFKPFSGERIFTSLEENNVFVRFVIPGQPNSPAVVRGFGVVFTDVDLTEPGVPFGTQIQFLDRQGGLLASAKAPLPPEETEGLSFAGAIFDEPVIAFATITSGSIAISVGLDEDAHPAFDVAAMDDFVIAEPIPLPPALFAALAAAAPAALAWRRLRRHNAE
jgi:hypothetical protein